MIRHRASILMVSLTLCPLASAAQLAEGGKATSSIVLGASATSPEKTAAQELAKYLAQVTGGTFSVLTEPQAPTSKTNIYVGPTVQAEHHGLKADALGPEEWIIRTVGNNLFLLGGRPRGTLYAVYRFLEDTVGVHWWNPWEETVPRKPTLTIDPLNRRGKPTFRYRDVYMLYGNDSGRFAVRNRLNRQGDSAIAAEYGGEMDYGPPCHVHNFYKYIPPESYFQTHPEWFSLINGKRTTENAQLCLTNKDLRKEYAAKLKEYIRSSHEAATKAGRPVPLVFDISQNDCEGMCQCPDCQAITKAEGSETGPLLDFINAMADSIKADYPDVFIDTLAYMMTQQAPKSIRPRDNVIIRLCDTSSNFTQPITHANNRAFHDHLLSWSKISRNLRIWDYAVTYAQGYGLPLPTVQTYAIDYRFYAEHNVEGVFTEHEYTILADLRDLKIWMMIKLLEDPFRNYDELLKQFTDGFYGAAGRYVREYLTALEKASELRPSFLSMDASPVKHRYLDLQFIREATALFDRADQAAGKDAVLMRRLRHARLPLDRAALLRYPQLVRDWTGGGQDAKTFPLDRKAIALRCREEWYQQIDFRLPEAQRPAERLEADRELKFALGRRDAVPMPSKFAGLPLGTAIDFPADETRNWMDQARRVADTEAESGQTNRLELSDQDVQKYKLPMSWGLYDAVNKRNVGLHTIQTSDVAGPGYHWYKMGTFAIQPSCYIYFFWSWVIQLDIDGVIDPVHPDQKYEIWARIKFEGPAFPHARPGAKNAICVERVVLVKT